MKSFIRWAKADIRSGENIDLWLLVAIAAVTTVLGLLGVANELAISSVILATLALLAVSHLRARKEIGESLAIQHADRLSLLHATFPEKYYERRATLSSDYLFVGFTMGRTLATGRSSFESLLNRGGSIRVVLPDPDNLSVISMVADAYRHQDSPEAIAHGIRATIETLGTMPTQRGGTVEVRLLRLPARVGFNGLDLGTSDGLIMVQHYEFRPRAEAAPILVLHARSDEPWYSHFVEEAERIWAHATPLGRTDAVFQ